RPPEYLQSQANRCVVRSLANGFGLQMRIPPLLLWVETNYAQPGIKHQRFEDDVVEFVCYKQVTVAQKTTPCFSWWLAFD
ncbi:hypothetical protein ACVGW2_01200, partial [Enterobacter intestinihominis]